MKCSKGEALILSIAALFLAFTAGWSLRAGSMGGQPIRVETQRKLEPAQAVLVLSPPPSPPAESGGKPLPQGKLDINTATLEELQSLPGIGEKRAALILADREQNGPFRFPEDVTRVKGIGEEILEEMVDYITVGEETP